MCQSCGRKLKDTKSVERGYGPVCWGKAAGRYSRSSEVNTDIWADYKVPGQRSILDDYPEILPEGGKQL
ncbi:MAG: DUF6011 domain-containing protein [Lachnospiraceae bacterium]